MQVTLTPQDPKDSPMTFELEDGGSLSLGGRESEAELSWDLLQDTFRTHFHRQGNSLFIEKEADHALMVNGNALEGSMELQEGNSVGFNGLICTLAIVAENKAPTQSDDSTDDANDDDIFGSGPSATETAINGSFGAQTTVSVKNSRWLFKVLTGPNSGAQMSLEDGKVYTIGSDSSSCDIVLTDLSVSKQHLKLSVFASGEMIIEDLKSRNGVLINGEKIEEQSKQTSSAIVTAGATTFMVVDRTAEQKTIVTAHSTVKEKPVEGSSEKASTTTDLAPTSNGQAKITSPTAPMNPQKNKKIVLGVIAAIFLLLGFGLFSLFNGTAVVKESVRPGQAQEIAAVLEEYPYFEYQFHEATGVLTLNGHILSVKDKRQLLSKLSQIGLIRRVDDTNLIVDEIVWQQFNMALEKAFNGINLSATSPGEFVLTGTLETSSQAQTLNHYLQVNFPYNDNLQNKVVVLDQLLGSINEKLQSIASGELLAELNQGELILVGTVPSIRAQDFRQFVEQVKNTPGIRSVRNLVVEQTSVDDSGVIDITANYQVSGFSKSSDANTSVMINGRILQRGDQIDGMTVVSIRPRMVILDRDSIKFRITYNP